MWRGERYDHGPSGGIRRFADREDAGRKLAGALLHHRSEYPLVLGLPRGGVTVAFEIARALEAPLDVWVVRKLGMPGWEELGLGAVAEGGHVHLSRDVIAEVGIGPHQLEEVIRAVRAEVEERVQRYRTGAPRPQIHDRTVILVDDGIATGGTVRAAVAAIRAEAPRRIVLAVPVASADILHELSNEVDELVCLLAPEELYAVGLWYESFGQISDARVAELLELARASRG